MMDDRTPTRRLSLAYRGGACVVGGGSENRTEKDRALAKDGFFVVRSGSMGRTPAGLE